MSILLQLLNHIMQFNCNVFSQVPLFKLLIKYLLFFSQPVCDRHRFHFLSDAEEETEKGRVSIDIRLQGDKVNWCAKHWAEEKEEGKKCWKATAALVKRNTQSCIMNSTRLCQKMRPAKKGVFWSHYFQTHSFFYPSGPVVISRIFSLPQKYFFKSIISLVCLARLFLTTMLLCNCYSIPAV